MMKITFMVILFLMLGACSTSHLVDEYVDKELVTFHPKKILVIGLTPDGGLQRQFEYSLQQALESEGVLAEKSVDYFESSDDEEDQFDENLKNIEQQLLSSGFDAVLFSKLTGRETQVTLAQSYRNLSRTFETFSDYYYGNRPVHVSAQPEEYPVYNTETSLYCLCPNRSQDLIWRGKIDIVDPPGAATTINDYVRTLLKAFRKNNLLKEN